MKKIFVGIVIFIFAFLIIVLGGDHKPLVQLEHIEELKHIDSVQRQFSDKWYRLIVDQCDFTIAYPSFYKGEWYKRCREIDFTNEKKYPGINNIWLLSEEKEGSLEKVNDFPGQGQPKFYKKINGTDVYYLYIDTSHMPGATPELGVIEYYFTKDNKHWLIFSIDDYRPLNDTEKARYEKNRLLLEKIIETVELK